MKTMFLRSVAAALLAISHAFAQGYPAKPVRLIVQFAPGGLVDTMARTIQPKVAEALGQQVIIENRGGAGGTLAEAQVAKSTPDGYTVLFAGDAVSFNPHLYSGLPYDLFRDLVPVSQLARVPLALIVPAGLPVTTAQEFAAYARARPGQLSYASPGSGISMFATEIFKDMARIDLASVPYKGGGPALIDVVSGQVHALFTSVFLVAPQVKSGKIKALAVASDRRSPLLPETPTFIEAGFPDFIAGSWSGLLVPAGTPQAVIQRLQAEFARALRSPEVEARFRELGTEVIGSSPAEFAALLKKEYETQGRLIRELKISVN
jgi:tripartite-type tricarboxylate transporter receptor subunit TctC